MTRVCDKCKTNHNNVTCVNYYFIPLSIPQSYINIQLYYVFRWMKQIAIQTKEHGTACGGLVPTHCAYLAFCTVVECVLLA